MFYGHQVIDIFGTLMIFQLVNVTLSDAVNTAHDVIITDYPYQNTDNSVFVSDTS